MTLYAEVILPLPLFRTFLYLIPEGWSSRVESGMSVLVPFGERLLTGFIVKLRKRKVDKDFELKEICEILTPEPLFSPHFLSFTRKLSEYYFTSWGEILQTSLPASFLVKSKRRVSLSEKGKRALESNGLSDNEKRLLSFLQGGNYTPLFIKRRLGPKYTSSFLSRLERKGLIHVESEVRKKLMRREEREEASVQSQLEIDFSLDKELRQVVEKVFLKADEGRFSPFLLFGPGEKRESAYLFLIKHFLARKRRVLYLVPEISLTEFSHQRLRAGLARNIGLVHSRMTEREKEIEWRKAKQGRVDIVLGSRSALFSPLENLGLIIVDGEEDGSYCQQESPVYDARKGAWIRAREEKAVLVYGSEEPSVGMFFKAKKRQILLSLGRSQKGKKISVVGERMKGRVIGGVLKKKIEERMEAREPVIVFLNRRGYASLLFCSRCSHLLRCPRCRTHLSYHRRNDSLICHSCGYSRLKIPECPDCGGRIMRMTGLGVEAAEEELRKIFHPKKIVAVTSDVLRTERERQRVFESFRKGKVDILLGTQLLAHRLDLPPVSLVSILFPEILLGFPDYRASQRTYHSIRRMKGFCREENGGEVLIQTSLPDHYTIHTAAEDDYLAFYHREIRIRRLMNYPPFSHVAQLILKGSNPRSLAALSRQIRSQIVKKEKNIEVLGPALNLVRKKKGGLNIQMIIKARREAELERVLSHIVGEVRSRVSILRFWA
ncbi:MAG: primosomal protein N' [Candidatus Aminicenantales bacterium]